MDKFFSVIATALIAAGIVLFAYWLFFGMPIDTGF